MNSTDSSPTHSPYNTKQPQPPTSENLEEINKLQSIEVLEILSEGNFPVGLVYSPDDDDYYVLKIFPYEDDKISFNFTNEKILKTLDHPNILKAIASQDLRTDISDDDQTVNVSYFMTELAPYGDFCDLVMSKSLPIDEKLTRTYFHQLVEGVEYLHKNKIAHLDLKLENLLLGKKYILKLADFETSACFADKNAKPSKLFRGTADYRAPELLSGEIENPFAADIYSAGIILFTLMFRMFPYVEDKLTNGYDLQ